MLDALEHVFKVAWYGRLLLLSIAVHVMLKNHRGNVMSQFPIALEMRLIEELITRRSVRKLLVPFPEFHKVERLVVRKRRLDIHQVSAFLFAGVTDGPDRVMQSASGWVADGLQRVHVQRDHNSEIVPALANRSPDSLQVEFLILLCIAHDHIAAP